MKKINLPDEFVIFDTEYTTWEGAMDRGWSGPGEYREIVQIGAIIVEASSLIEKEKFLCYVRPVKNPVLSDFFIELTGISQQAVDKEGISYALALERFLSWTRGLHLYCWGTDLETMKENAELVGIFFPFPLSRKTDVKTLFEAHGVPTEGYHSSTIPRAFGEEPPSHGHDALNDARSILQGLRALQKQIA